LAGSGLGLVLRLSIVGAVITLVALFGSVYSVR
jgi:hypothetical protein